MDETPAVVLAVYAHPDDADVGCGGSLARWAKAGSAVHLVVCTDGGKGTSDAAVVPTELAAERASELEASSALIGLRSVENLGCPTASSSTARPSGASWCAGCGRCGPTWSAATTRRRSSSGRTTSTTGTTAFWAWPCWTPWRRRRRCPHYFPEAGPPHQVPTVLLSGTLEPDEWVDVTDTIETKAAAVECHRTQFAGSVGWAGEAVRRRAAEEGRRAGVAYAEGFRRLTLGA